MIDKLQALQAYLQTNLNTYISALSTTQLPLDAISNTGVVIDQVDIDKYKGSFYVFIPCFCSERRERETFQSDKVTLPVEVSIVVCGKKDSLKVLTQYIEAVKNCLNHDKSINGSVFGLSIDGTDGIYSYADNNQCLAAVVQISLLYSEDTD